MKKKPNIIFILSDDQGAWAMHCAGNKELHTPNLDRLASMGMRFENFFCASPVCSPARASILTGEIPSQHGIHDWLCGGNLDQSTVAPFVNETRFCAEHEAIGYLDGHITYTDILKENGYRCALSGKWHLGDSLRPQHGFEKWFTIGRGGTSYYHSDVVENRQLKFTEEYLTDVITQHALGFLNELSQESEPFYLSVHYTAPHGPWDENNHPPHQIERYRNCPFTETPDVPHHPWVTTVIKNGEMGLSREEKLRGFYAAVTAMDEGIGAIIDRVEELGQTQNTIFIFTSDNGMSMGHHGIWGKGNGTLPLNMYDTAVKVPFIFSAPQGEKGVVVQTLHSHYDIIQTFVDYLGLKGELPTHLPGKSFAPVLRGEKFAQTPVVVLDEYGPVRMIRTTQWKYVCRTPYGPDELYNLETDPEENENLINDPEHAQTLQTLRSQLQKWFCKYANPELDGTREGVTGAGQWCRAGVHSEGKNTYKPRI